MLQACEHKMHMKSICAWKLVAYSLHSFRKEWKPLVCKRHTPDNRLMCGRLEQCKGFVCTYIKTTHTQHSTRTTIQIGGLLIRWAVCDSRHCLVFYFILRWWPAHSQCLYMLFDCCVELIVFGGFWLMVAASTSKIARHNKQRQIESKKRKGKKWVFLGLCALFNQISANWEMAR